MDQGTKITHDSLKRAITERFCLPYWMALEEVRDATGFDGRCSIDVLAFGMYVSRGHELIAFECKAERSDFLKELRTPDKANAFADVDRFFIVAPTGMVKKDELPAGWGLISVSRTKTGNLKSRVTKQAPLLRSDERVIPMISRSLLASIAHRQQKIVNKYQTEGIFKVDIRQQMKEEYDRGVSDGRYEAKGGDVARKLAQLEKAISEFEDASGVRINQWGGGTIGAKVKIVTRVQNVESLAEQTLRNANNGINRLRIGMRELKEEMEANGPDERAEAAERSGEDGS